MEAIRRRGLQELVSLPFLAVDAKASCGQEESDGMLLLKKKMRVALLSKIGDGFQMPQSWIGAGKAMSAMTRRGVHFATKREVTIGISDGQAVIWLYLQLSGAISSLPSDELRALCRLHHDLGIFLCFPACPELVFLDKRKLLNLMECYFDGKSTEETVELCAMTSSAVEFILNSMKLSGKLA